MTKLREEGYYEPLTDEEFEQFKIDNPDLAAYFEEAEGEPDQKAQENKLESDPLPGLEVPEGPERAPIYDQWEKAAQRLMNTIGRHQNAYIFAEPVDSEKYNIPDYHTYVKNPMDFGTIKNKLKTNQYANVKDFQADMELTFDNCKLYNGEITGVGQMGKVVREEYTRLNDQLHLDFYH